jgi:hypothetical protein
MGVLVEVDLVVHHVVFNLMEALFMDQCWGDHLVMF